MTTLTAPAPTVHHSRTEGDPWGLRLSQASLVAMPLITVALLAMLPADANVRATDTASAQKVLAAAAQHRTGVWVGSFLLAALFLLLIPGLHTVLHRVTGRGRALVRIGWTISCIGAAAVALVDFVPAIALRAATAPGLDSSAMIDATVALQKEHGPLSPLYWTIPFLLVGLVVMAVGVVRSTELRWWHAVLVVVAPLSVLFAGVDLSGYVAAGLLAALAGVMLFRSPTAG